MERYSAPRQQILASKNDTAEDLCVSIQVIFVIRFPMYKIVAILDLESRRQTGLLFVEASL
jgi:hypothetical protein